MDSQVHPLPHGLSWSNLPCSARFPRDIPLFSPTGVLVNLDCSAVQHQRCFVQPILLNQGYEDIFPYSGFCPAPKPTVYALPWTEPFRQIPPWNSRVQPVQNRVKHFPVAFPWTPSLRLPLRREPVLDPIPLFFAYFMFLHAPILLHRRFSHNGQALKQILTYEDLSGSILR